MEGRSEKCPSEYWYKGEIGFFEVSRLQTRDTVIFFFFNDASSVLTHKRNHYNVFFLVLIVLHYPIGEKTQGMWCIWCIK